MDTGFLSTLSKSIGSLAMPKRHDQLPDGVALAVRDGDPRADPVLRVRSRVNTASRTVCSFWISPFSSRTVHQLRDDRVLYLCLPTEP